MEPEKQPGRFRGMWLLGGILAGVVVAVVVARMEVFSPTAKPIANAVCIVLGGAIGAYLERKKRQT